MVKDKRRGICADPTKVRDIDHDGKYYNMHGCHLCEPSPQRTPVLFHASASARGSDFAAEHAECVFLMGPTPQIAGDYTRNIRARITTNVARTILHSFCATDSDRRWTLRDIAAYVGMGGVGPVLVGAPEQIADQLEAWTEVGVDGFNLSYAMLPNSYVDFIEGGGAGSAAPRSYAVELSGRHVAAKIIRAREFTHAIAPSRRRRAPTLVMVAPNHHALLAKLAALAA